MIRIAAIVLLVGSLVTPQVAEEPLPAGIQAILDVRAAAVMSGDRTAFVATADRSAAEAQGRRFDGARSVGFSGYALRLRDDIAGDLSTAAIRARYTPARAVTVLVEVRTTFPAYDVEPALVSDFLTFVERADGWKVAGDSDLEGIGLLSSRELWDLGPVVQTASERVLLLSHPDGRARAEAILPIMETALDREVKGLDITWPEKVVVIVPSSVAELQRLLQSTVDLSNFVGFAYWSVDRTTATGFDLTAPRVILNPDTFFLADDTVREDILTHELVHVATRQVAGPGTSSWVDEGMADLVATGPGTAPPPPDDALPEDWRFGSGGGTAIRDAYVRSRSFVAFLDTRAPDGARRYYEELGRTVGRPGSRERLQDDAARAVFGRPLAELRADWAGSG